MLLLKRSVTLLIICVCLIACRRQDALRQTVLRGATMGTTYTVKIVADVSPGDKQAVVAEIEKTLAQINSAMSTYDPHSELSRWNALRSTAWFGVSPAVAAVVAESIRIGRLSEGSFDVTVDPLVRLWNFGPDAARETKKIPSPQEVNKALQLVDYSRLDVRNDPPAVRKAVAEMQVDLSGIAPGYAVDRLAELLESRGRRNYMVEIGGEVRCAGHNVAGGDWRIAIETPLPGERRVESIVQMGNRVMATSGDYRNYFEIDGVRYSHLIDPRTGSPIRHRLASVSVLSDRCAEADALATGLMVLGPEAGYKLAQSHGIAAGFIVRSGQGFEQKRTTHWPKAELPRASNAQNCANIAIVWIASLLALAAVMLALAIGPAFRKKKRQCACKADELIKLKEKLQ